MLVEEHPVHHHEHPVHHHEHPAEHHEPAVDEQPHEPIVVESRTEELIVEQTNLLPPDHHEAETSDVHYYESAVEPELTVHRTEYTELPTHAEPAAEQHYEAEPVHESTLADVPTTTAEPEIQIQQDYHEHAEHIAKEEPEPVHSGFFEIFTLYL